jgi:hypothetical protein
VAKRNDRDVFFGQGTKPNERPQHDCVWIDKPGASRNDQRAWEMPMFGLRLGIDPRVCAAGIRRAMKLIEAMVADSKTVISKSTTYEDHTHFARYSLGRSFRCIRARASPSTRLTTSRFRSPRAPVSCVKRRGHVSVDTEFDQRYPIRIAIDAGMSRLICAVIFPIIARSPG